MSILDRIRAIRGKGRTRAEAPVPEAEPAAADDLMSVADSPFDGFVDELSPYHVAGWLTGPGDCAFEVALPDGRVLGRGRADQFKPGPSDAGQGTHGFLLRFERKLTAEERDAVVVRPVNAPAPLPRAACMLEEYRPVILNAMDIVDNCNLRCPFCLFDYSHVFKTNVMERATIEAALRFLPYVPDSNFWFSCLHEPTLNPNFVEFLELVPREYRRKVFFTTNLAKRMKPEYYRFLADGGFANVNISIESRDPEIYERMRKGARYRIFAENWQALLDAVAEGSAPPFLRYITMVYRSNFAEIPDLVEHLVSERRADEVQLRFTYDVAHIDDAFRKAEYIDEPQWDILDDLARRYPPGKVVVVRPPTQQVVEEFFELRGRYQFRTSWDGSVKVLQYRVPFPDEAHPLVETNVRDIADPLAFFASLPA